MKYLKVLGSLSVAIFLISLLVVLLTLSTFMESAYGTPFAHKVIYGAGWFDIILALVWINIFCSTLTRLPFKKHHTGFVVTHIGILALLLGALIGHLGGHEGQIQLFESEAKDRITQEGHSLFIKTPDAGTEELELGKQLPRGREGAIPGTHLHLRVESILENAVKSENVTEGASFDPVNHAVEAELSSDMAGLHQSFTLVEHDPASPDSARMQIGPARMELKTGQPPAEQSGKTEAAAKPVVLHLMQAGKTWDVPIGEKNPAEIPVGNGLVLSDVRYFPHAKIEGDKLVDAPGEIRFNPAVEFTVSDGKGHHEDHTKFFLFPHFNSLHGGEAADVFHLGVMLETDFPDDMKGPQTGSKTAGVTFFAKPDGSWIAHIASSHGAKDLPVRAGDKIPTGWMDMQLTIKHLFERAKVSSSIEENKEGQGFYAAKISAGMPGRMKSVWLMDGDSSTLDTPEGPLTLQLMPKTMAVPFTLKLKDFRKKVYPGTDKPAAFESDVTLLDDADGVTLNRTISMNKPLDYKGWRIFQSSYIEDPDLGEGSVFSVAKNPGIKLIYGGAITIFIGIILLFYLHPFFNASVKRQAAPKSKPRPTHRPKGRR